MHVVKFALFFILMLSHNLSASIIKITPKDKDKEKDPTFQELVCTDEDVAKITEIVTTIADTNKLSLLFKQTHLRELGAQINHVHPLKFLSTVFSNPHLKTCMFYIWNDSFKRSGFIDGLGPSLTRESDKGKLAQYLPDFSKEVGASQKDMQVYVDQRDWDNFVVFLIHS